MGRLGPSGLFDTRLVGAELWDQNQRHRWLSCVSEYVCVWVCVCDYMYGVFLCVYERVIVSVCI